MAHYYGSKYSINISAEISFTAIYVYLQRNVHPYLGHNIYFRTQKVMLFCLTIYHKGIIDGLLNMT